MEDGGSLQGDGVEEQMTESGLVFSSVSESSGLLGVLALSLHPYQLLGGNKGHMRT